MYGKTLKDLNNKSFVKKNRFNNLIYEKITSEREFSYFRIKLNSNKQVVINNSQEVNDFLDEFDKMDIDDISPRESLDFLYKLKSKRQTNGNSKFKK